MAWTSPRTWVVGEVLTAGNMNLQVRDNENDLHARSTVTGNILTTSQTTTSTSYVDLATVGPSVTVTTGTSALVDLQASFALSVSGAIFMSVALSGATTLAAADDRALSVNGAAATTTFQCSSVILLTGLTPGSNTFTAKYRVSTGTGTWLNRRIAVMPGNQLS